MKKTKNSETESIIRDPFRINSSQLLHSPLYYAINARRVFIIVGGSAISFGLPLLRILNFNGVNVRLIWVSRDFHDLKLLNYFKNNFEGMEIYITGFKGNEQDIQIDYIDYEHQRNNELCAVNNTENSYLLTEHERTSHENRHFHKCNTTNNLTNLAGIDNSDEIDFTGMFATHKPKSKSDINLSNNARQPLININTNFFRDPVTLGFPQNDSENFHPNEQLDENQDVDMNLKIPSGVKVFFGRPILDDKDYEWCLQRECSLDSEGNVCFDRSINDAEELSNVWVLAAGPDGLVEGTRRWATDVGLRFHGENYAI